MIHRCKIFILIIFFMHTAKSQILSLLLDCERRKENLCLSPCPHTSVFFVALQLYHKITLLLSLNAHNTPVMRFLLQTCLYLALLCLPKLSLYTWNLIQKALQIHGNLCFG